MLVALHGFTRKSKKLLGILAQQPVQSSLVFASMVIFAIMETVSLSLLIPVTSLILDEKPITGISNYLDPIYSTFPDYKPLHILLGLMVALTFVKSGVELFKVYGSSRLSWGLYESWTNTILKKYLYSPFSYILAQRQGTLISNLAEPANASKTMLNFFEFAATFVIVASLYAGLWLIHWKGTLILTIGGAVLAFGFRQRVFGSSKAAGKERLLLNQRMGAFAAENIVALRLIRTYGLEKVLLERFESATRELSHITIKFETLRAAAKPAIEAATVLGIAAFITVVDYRTTGNFKPILPTLAFVLLAVRRLLSYVPLLISQIMGIQFSLSSLALVDDLTRIPAPEGENRIGLTFQRLEDDIVFENVTFEYGADRPVLSDFNLRIPKGKMTAIVGPSGVGKSTVADLMLALVAPSQGRILINGHPLTEYQLNSWRQKIGYVSQETILLGGSIAENIRFGNLAARDEEVIEAAKRAALHDFVMSLPQGYKTRVGDRGLMLSGGQRQRVAIARALVRKPELFIFDEATSALDEETEKSIQASIERLAGDKTVVIIAHRLSTIEKAHVLYDFKTKVSTYV